MRKRYQQADKWKRAEVIFELVVFGVVVGVIEDIVAIKLVTGEDISWSVVGMVILIAVPFAVLGEVIFDRINFADIFQKMFTRR